MSKLITLENLATVLSKLDLGGNEYLKYLADTPDTSGNVYIYGEPQGNMIIYNDGHWHGISAVYPHGVRLYRVKPRKRCLAVRMRSGSRIYYAGLVATSSEQASGIRVRYGGKTYALESMNPDLWYGIASVEDGAIKITSLNALDSYRRLTLFDDEDVEIYIKFSMIPKTLSTSGTQREKWRPIFRMLTDEEYYFKYSNANYLQSTPPHYCDVAMIDGLLQLVSSNYGGTTLKRDLVVGEDTGDLEFKWSYDATAKTFETTYNGDTVSKWTFSTTNTDPTNIRLSMGDTMLRGNITEMKVKDFHVKIDGVAVLNFATMLNEYS